MKDLVEYIARSVVDDPDSVRVTETSGEKTLILELRVAEGDMGKVIGKEGRVAEAMRTLLKVAAARQGKRAVLQII
ncbi:MAG: KH domain-containing protein [Dehalococcoidia bacterium]|nr:KH domain-containing protein [Dehalococcoidia bacterium]